MPAGTSGRIVGRHKHGGRQSLAHQTHRRRAFPANPGTAPISPPIRLAALNRPISHGYPHTHRALKGLSLGGLPVMRVTSLER
jgi:hypothetical protein